MLTTLNIRPTFEDIILQKMETTPWINLQGIEVDTPCEYTLEAYKMCWMFFMRTMFQQDAAEQQLFYMQFKLKKPKALPARVFDMLGTAPTGGREVSFGNIEVLTSTLIRIVEEQGSSAEILEKMHKFAVNKEDEKKEKSVKWHPSTTKFVRNAASTDGITPATSIPLTFRRVINADSLGQADIELTEQMMGLGHEEIEWDLIFTNSIRHGMFCYAKSDIPSNFTIFGIRLKNPTALNEQHARGMKLHILESGKDNNKKNHSKLLSTTFSSTQ